MEEAPTEFDLFGSLDFYIKLKNLQNCSEDFLLNLNTL